MANQLPSDNDLFSQIKSGDQTAFRQLFDRYYQVLLAIAINLLKDAGTAKDMVQEVFLKIWRKRASLEVPRSTEAYLKRSVINRSLDYLKTRKSTLDISEQHRLASKGPVAQELLEATDLQAIIDQALADLPEACRTIFIMKRMEGRRVKEIAQLLDISPKTVENQITKALKFLQARVRPYLDQQQSS